jgi:hypothetical protein
VPPPPGPGALNKPTPTDFVNAYLDSTAGGVTPDGQIAAAKAFMTSDQASGWNPGPGVTVVRQIGDLVDTPGSSQTAAFDEVTGVFQVVGQFSVTTGVLDPPTSSKTKVTLNFQVGMDDESGEPRLLAAPSIILMSESALQSYFIPHPIYLWDTAHKALIPDLRYVSSVQSPIVQATNIVNWVLSGQSDWLDTAVAPLVVNASLVDPTIKIDKSGAYVVNLSPSAHALSTAAQLQLAYELRWSLGSGLVADPTRNVVPSPVEIEIDGQPQIVSADDNYRTKVPNLMLPRSPTEAATYGILNGKVLLISVDTSANVTTQVAGQPQVLDSPKNAGVILGAVNGAASAAALVRRDGRGNESLWIRRLGPSSSDFVRVNLPAGDMTRPQFITQPLDAVVVSVNGQPYLINRSNQVHAIELPSGIANITAFSVAADGRRIAFVSNGELFMSVLTNTDSNPAMTVQKPIQLGYLTKDSQISQATAVAWSSVDQLIVAGNSGSRSTVAEVDVGGALEQNVHPQEYGALTISQVAAYSYDPFVETYFDNVMVQTNGGAYAGRTARLPLRIGTPGHTTPLSSPFFQD